jgi:hypothetical protein
VRSAGIGNHPPLLRLVGSADAVAAGATVGLPALVTALTVAGVAVGAFGAADDRPDAGGGLADAAFAVQFDHDVGAQGGVFLVAADPLVQLGAGGSWAGRAPGLRATNTGGRRRSSAGGPPCGLRAGMPRPWRAKALRSDGQVVPNSAAAALTLPSRSASWKARSASAGRQRTGWAASPGGSVGTGRSGGSPGTPANPPRCPVW